ncbi:MAG: AAA family ATPase [Rhizobiaceae bacterium]
MSVTPEIEETILAARRFAALRESFAPSELLLFLSARNIDQSDNALVRAVATLRDDCIRPSVEDRLLWSMRTRRRRRVLEDLPEEEMSDFASAQDVELRDAALSEGAFQTLQEKPIAAAFLEGEELQKVVTTIESVGDTAGSFDRLAELRGRISQEKTIGNMLDRTLMETFGRRNEVDRILDWYHTPMVGLPAKALYIRGGSGSGKSHLMDHAIIELDDDRTEHPIIVKLDFGQSGFEYYTGYGFFSEMSRQVADAAPESAGKLRELRGRYVNETAAAASLSQTIGQPVEFVTEIAASVKPGRRPLLVILDGIDTLQNEGETRADRVFQHLDLLLDAGVETMTVLMAGRMPFPASCKQRLAGVVELEGLDDEAANKILEHGKVPEGIRSEIVGLARGNPLLLHLAAEAVKKEGNGIPLELNDDANADFVERLRATLLSSLPEPLRKIVDAGLFLRWLDSDAITHIIAPAVRANGLQADAIMEQLTGISWLFEQEASRLRVCDVVRSVFLAGHYDNAPKLAKTINSAAADFYVDVDPDTALYHRLQLVRFGSPLPIIKRGGGAALADNWLSELPQSARNAVRLSQGRRSKTRYRKLVEGKPCDQHHALHDLEIALRGCDLREANLIASKLPDRVFDSPHGKLLQMAWFWLSGQWSKAHRLWREPVIRNTTNFPESGYYLLRRVMLEMRAEFGFRNLVGSLRDESFFKEAVEVHRATQHTGLSGGALDFAFLAACRSMAELPETAETALASVSIWLPPGDGLSAEMWHERADRLAIRCGGPAASSSSEDTTKPQSEQAHYESFSKLNPYAIPLRHLAAFGPNGVLSDYLEKLRGILPHIASANGKTLSSQHLLPAPTGTVDMLTGLGLTADWSGGFSFFHPVPDFPRIARAAQRWQRTLGGAWNFPSNPPKAWRGSNNGDLGTEMRIERYNKEGAGVALAWQQLEAAHTPGGSSSIRGKVESRVALHIEKAKESLPGGVDAMSAALKLQENGVAGAIAVPLSIIANQMKTD